MSRMSVGKRVTQQFYLCLMIALAATSFSCAALGRSPDALAAPQVDDARTPSKANLAPKGGDVRHPFEFKVAHLGMSLEDFKKAASGEPYEIAVGEKRGLFGKKTPVIKKIPTPICSDGEAGQSMSGLPDFGAGIVYCDASPGELNLSLRTVAGTPMYKVVYLFYKNRLYFISMEAIPRMFNLILGSFSEKYGDPVRLPDDSFQNGYGATWAGRNYVWTRGEEVIILSEGSGNGPPQAGAKPFNVTFLDHSLAPAGAAPVVDF